MCSKHRYEFSLITDAEWFYIFNIYFNYIFWACSLVSTHHHALNKQHTVPAAAPTLALCLLLPTACPPGYFGERCEEQCDCIHSVSCHPQTGACRCAKGWRGRHCDKRECLWDRHPIAIFGSGLVLRGCQRGAAWCHPALMLMGFGVLLQPACLATTVWVVPGGAAALQASPATT